jgi:hypothetical protein
MNPAVVAAVVSGGIAALTAAGKALIDLSGGGRNAARDAHRRLLGEHLMKLGRDVPGVVATAHVYLARASGGDNLDSWRKKTANHGHALGELRRDTRYLLYGADEALRVLGRVGSWVQHFADYDELGTEFLAGADALRRHLDRVIAKSYRRGEPPSWTDRRRLDRAAASVVEVWDRRMAGAHTDEPVD